MSRPPHIHFLSPLDPRLKVPKHHPSAIPVPVVKGLIRGLLSHLWSQDRRRTNEVGMPQEKIETDLLLFAYQVTAYAEQEPTADLSKIETFIPTVFAARRGHNPILFKYQSDFLLGVQADESFSPPYSSLRSMDERVRWIKKHLHDSLEKLKEYAPCSECRMKTTLPPDATLEEWATPQSDERHANVGALRDVMLGYFHDEMAPSTVKRIRSSKLAPQTP